MKNRRRNNIIIGTLCCVLVLMGVGYAILSTTLNIGATAKISGDFDIHFLDDDQNKKGISLIDYPASQTAGSTVYNTTVTSKATLMEAGTEVDSQDPKVAEFDAILQKPTDYATFTAIAKNYGTIKGIISDVTITSTPSQELTTWLSTNGGSYSDYFEVTSTAAVDTVINPGDEYQFTVTVRFKESATKLPEGALNNTIEITYVQDNGQSYAPQIAYVDQDDSCFISFRAGEINYYDTSKQGCGSTVTIPDNLRLKTSTLTGYTFNSQLCLAFAPNLKGTMGYDSLTDEQFCGGLQNTIAQLYNSGQEDLYDEIYSGFVIPTYTEATGNYSVITKVGAGSFVARSISSLTLSSNITEIKEAAFTNNSFTTVTLPNSLTSIGKYAFMFGGLTSVTIPSSLHSIGESAFSRNSITSLNLANASSLTSIGSNAFYNNSLGTLDLSGATSLTTIGRTAFHDAGVSGILTIPSTVITIEVDAFVGNRLTTVDLSSASSLTSIGESAFSIQQGDDYSDTLTSINASNKTKAQYDTISNNHVWYDDDNANFHITYSDVTCDYNGTCTAN